MSEKVGVSKMENGDTISRQAALDALAKYIYNAYKAMEGKTLPAEDCRNAAESVIGELPSAQQNRQTGEWIYGEDDCGQDGWTCSKCGFFVPWYYNYNKNIDFIWRYKTCPCCDAKMVTYTGKKEEENEQGY